MAQVQDTQQQPPQQQMMKSSAGCVSMKDKLESMDGMILKQQFDFLERIQDKVCERENKYAIYRKKEGQETKVKKSVKEFKFREEAKWFGKMQRGALRPFRGMVKNLQKDKENNDNCLRCNKDCKCQFYCFNRQVLEVFNTEGGKEEKLIGTVFDKFNCSNFTYQINDAENTLMFTVLGKMCQAYFWCRCPCKSCLNVEFKIFEGESDDQVGSLTKHGISDCAIGCKGNMGTEIVVDFPKKAKWDAKALFMCMSVFLEYTMFE